MIKNWQYPVADTQFTKLHYCFGGVAKSEEGLIQKLIYINDKKTVH